MSHKLVTALLFLFIFSSHQTSSQEVLKFPPGFKLGVATASYQIEGGWNASGKGVNIWDTLTHTFPNLITDHTTGDIACDSYHLWEEDIKNLKFLNVDHYRFSLSWSRLLPDGFSNVLNSDGVNYYNRLINALLASKIEPIVTIYHWDLPQTLQDLGGWTNPKIADYFAEYANAVFTLFGDRVKTWITINEPASICVDVYENDDGAPHVHSPGIGLYLCGKTILLAHAKAFTLYDQKFRTLHNGSVGFTIDSIWAEPKTNSSKDIEAAEREMQMQLGWWAHPIFSKKGDYPPLMKNRIANISQEENFLESRLPPFTTDEIKMIRGSSDFFGLNHYHTYLVEDFQYKTPEPSYFKDKGTVLSQSSNWRPNVNIVPWGIRKLLTWIKDEYNNPPVIITENGYNIPNASLDDHERIYYLNEYMRNVLLAISKDQCDVRGYTVWSLMDNMEWREGYT